MSSIFSRRKFAAGTAGAFATIGAIQAPVRAADFILKLGTTQALEAPINIRAKQAGDRIRKLTNGRVDVQVFPNSVLGGMTAMISQVRAGDLQFLTADVTTLSGVVPLASVPNVGFAFKSSAQGLAACDGDLGAYVRASIRAKGMYCHDKTMLIGMKAVTSTPRAIAVPDDFHGFKIRVPPGALSLDLFRTLGASVTAMDVNQVYTSLETHVIDGQENPLVNIEFQKFFEVQKYLSLTGHQWSGYYMIGHQEMWNSLPPNFQTIVTREFAQFIGEQNRDVDLLNETLRDKLHRQGMTVNHPSPDPFKAQLQSGGFYTRWKNEFGATAWSLLEKYSGKLG